MSLAHVRRATFFCPTMTTGGPEAIHQVAQILGRTGLPTDIAYFGGDGSFSIDGGEVLVTPPTDNPCLEEYARYEPVVCRRLLLRRHHLLVFPETVPVDPRFGARASVATWWLSVDNGLAPAGGPSLAARLADRTVTHLAQSAYAEDFLRGHGVTAAYRLGDYTDPAFTDVVPTAPNPDPVVAHNPAKGAELAEVFFGAHRDVVGLPLRGMGKDAVGEALRRARVYVDFGHLPGKDRMPREAAAAGAVVFVRRRGAGANAEDFPVPDFFRFDDDDVASGELHRRVAAVQADPAPHWAQQELFRERIRGERAELEEQLRVLRGLRPAA